MFELFIQGGSFSFNLMEKRAPEQRFFCQPWKCFNCGNYQPKIKCLWSLELLSFYLHVRCIMQEFIFRKLLLGVSRCCFELKLLPSSSFFSSFYCLIIVTFYLKLLFPSASSDINLSINYWSTWLCLLHP